jgi:hypothetical protein
VDLIRLVQGVIEESGGLQASVLRQVADPYPAAFAVGKDHIGSDPDDLLSQIFAD